MGFIKRDKGKLKVNTGLKLNETVKHGIFSCLYIRDTDIYKYNWIFVLWILLTK